MDIQTYIDACSSYHCQEHPLHRLEAGVKEEADQETVAEDEAGLAYIGRLLAQLAADRPACLLDQDQEREIPEHR